MSDPRLDKYLKRLFGVEGGFTLNRADPGNWTGGKCGKGECKGTKFGIAANTYPATDIANLTLPQARAIYERDYWPKVFGSMLPDPLAYQVFDAAVNHGVDRATRLLQAALRVPVDGVFGPKTLLSVQACNPPPITMRFMQERIAFYTGLKTWGEFGKGWMNRMAENMGYMAEDAR